MSFKDWLKQPRVLTKGKSFTCKKDLYKSTYLANAFDQKKQYNVVESDSRAPWVQANDPEIIWVLDNKGESFSFARHQVHDVYVFEDYFDEVNKDT